MKNAAKFLSFMVPTIIFTNYNLNIFYSIGATLLDSGWFTYLATNLSGGILENPPVLKGTHLGLTYFNTHVSLIYVLFAFLYEVMFFWMTPMVYLSILFASFYGFVALSVFMMGVRLGVAPWVLLLGSVLVSFNAQSLAMVGFAHSEVAIIAFMFMFLSLHVREKKGFSYLFFVLMLSVREDGGFHFFGLVFVFVCLEFLENKSLRVSKPFVKFAIIGALYSVVAIVGQRMFFEADDAFVRIYSGEPFFAHLSFEFLAARLEFMFHNREYLYVSVFLLLVFSVMYRNIYLLVSVVSIVPWTLLSLVAVTDMAGTLSNYYGFVFVMIFAWIPFAFYIKYEHSGERHNGQLLISLFVVTLSSMVLFVGNSGNSDSAPWEKLDFSYKGEILQSEKFREYVQSNRDSLGNILFDEAMSTLFVKSLRAEEYMYLNGFSESAFGEAQREGYTTLIFKKGSSWEVMSELIRDKRLSYVYRVRGTDIVVASMRQIPSADFLVDEL